jgi:RimJ/RimL family protein N-acetyltransferase
MVGFLVEDQKVLQREGHSFMKRLIIAAFMSVTALNGMQIAPVDKDYGFSRDAYDEYYKKTVPSITSVEWSNLDICSRRIAQLGQQKPLPSFLINTHENNSFELKPVNAANVGLFEDFSQLLRSNECKPYIDEDRCMRMVIGSERAWFLHNTIGNQKCIGASMYTPLLITPNSAWCANDKNVVRVLNNKKVLELEYYLDFQHRKRGVVSAAVTELIAFMKQFETGDDGFEYLIAGIPSRNENSTKVVKRLAFNCISETRDRQVWIYPLR